MANDFIAGAEVIRSGSRMSTRNIQKGDIVTKVIFRGGGNYVSGGGGGGGSSQVSQPAPPSVEVSGSEVFIGGQGFTVRPEDQASFIQQHGGSVTSQIQQQIVAEQQRQELAKIEQARQEQKLTDVQRVREQSIKATIIRQKAREEGYDISTPVRERKYISELKQREQLQKEKQKEEQVKQDFFNKIAEKKMSVSSPHIPIFSISGGGATTGFVGQPKGPTIREVKQMAGQYGYVAGGIAGVVPETYAGLGLTTAFMGTYSYLPKIVKLGVTGGITTTSAKEVLSSTTTKQEKITAGIIGVGAGAGLVFETIPFVKGGVARFSPDYASVKTQPELFKAIELTDTRIGLIEAGKGTKGFVDVADISPLKRGGFGVKPSEKKLFLGYQTLTTSQRGLFKAGKDIPLQKEFYTTPQEPFLKIPETRISRLGLDLGLFELPKSAEVGWGLPKSAQIGITEAVVTRTGKKETFKIGTGTELEAIKETGTIKGVEKIGVTTIKGQAVDIFRYKIGKGEKVTTKLSTKDLIPSTKSTTQVSGYGMLSLTSLTTRTKPKTTGFMPTTKQLTSFKTPTIKSISYTPTTKTITPSIISYSKTMKTKTTPLKTFTQTYTTPYKTSYPTIPKTTTSFMRLKLKPTKQPKKQKGFSVYVRRFGMFKPIGTKLSLKKAFELGRGRVSRTLGATFKVEGMKGLTYKTPKGFRKKVTPKGTLFIEKRKYRLSKAPEKKEIKYWKAKKKKEK